MKKVKVRVPATTSNLGPVLDGAGLALSLYNELTLEWHEEPGETTCLVEGEGAGTLSDGDQNLVARAAFTILGGRRGRLALHCVNRIPLARGLGSSAAAAVAGMLAANAVLGDEALSKDELLEYAATLEGHPDNAAPALLGGLVACLRRLKKTLTFPLKPHPDLRVVACVPDFELATSAARAVLPRTYLREDAVDNVARAFLLGSALEQGHWDRLPTLMDDRFHQPYRAPLVRGLASVIKAAQDAATCGAALSGAGPTVAAFAPAGAPLQKIGEAMSEAWKRQGVSSRVLVLTAASGAEVVECG